MSHRRTKAHNKYINSCNEDFIPSCTNDLDANNLYGLAMSEKLPYADLEWSDDIKNVDDVMQYEHGDHGYFLEVDLGYPAELHDLHSDYPLAP